MSCILFLPRRPRSSSIIASVCTCSVKDLVLLCIQSIDVVRVLTFLVVLTDWLSLDYIQTKLATFIFGFLFWHIDSIIITVLSPSDRARILILFMNSPTDVEYAMDLMRRNTADSKEEGKETRKGKRMQT